MYHLEIKNVQECYETYTYRCFIITNLVGIPVLMLFAFFHDRNILRWYWMTSLWDYIHLNSVSMSRTLRHSRFQYLCFLQCDTDSNIMILMVSSECTYFQITYETTHSIKFFFIFFFIIFFIFFHLFSSSQFSLNESDFTSQSIPVFMLFAMWHW